MSGPLESSITLEEVFAVVSAKRVPLAPELAGYLVLEIAEGAGLVAGEVDPRQVYIGDEGTVAIVRQKRADANGDTEESIRVLLQRLLEASGSLTPALDTAAKRAPGAGVASLAQELELALIPVNRAAGRRALARLAREVKRVTLGVGRNASVSPESRGLRSSNPSQPVLGGDRPSAPGARPRRRGRSRDEVDSLLSAFEVEAPAPRSDSIVALDLKEIAGIVGLTPTPPPPPGYREGVAPVTRTPAQSFPSSSREGAASGGFPGSRDLDRTPGVPAAVPSSPMSSSAPLSTSSPLSTGSPLSRPISSGSPSLRRPVLEAPGLRDALGSSGGSARRGRGSNVLLVMALLAVLVVGALILTWIWRTGSSRAPGLAAAEKGAADGIIPSASALARPPVRPCKATVVITDAPPNAEMLVRAGQAPLDVARMPVGARLEFVATADGYAPKRAVVPGRVPWDTSSGKPRYELSVELERSRVKPGAIDPWPPGEPGSEVGGHGAPGTVHVTANPRGAEIWLLTGLGPEASIDQLACDTDVDILVAGPSTFRKRLHIGQGEFTEVAAPTGELARKARISAK